MPEKTPARALGVVGLVLSLIFGVALPALTLGIELFSGMCSGILFDPAPSILHTVLIAFVPAANLALILALRAGTPLRRPRLHGWMNALTLGISGYYALMFLPFTPFALMGILFFGVGLLPLSPLTSFIIAIVLRVRARRLPSGGDEQAPVRLEYLWRGAALAIALLAVLEIPAVITQAGLRMAVSEEPAMQARGIGLLRKAGRREMLLSACYAGGRMPGNVVDFAFTVFDSPVPASQVRDIYYRVTGTPFNMLKPPSRPFGRRQNRDWILDFDTDVGGDAVQGRVRGLSLQESRLDGVIRPDSAVAYGEWTLVFRNGSPRQQEARLVAALPPGGVVSRLTLWVDGEEREAAFAGRGKVKQAYQQVVRRRQDPVLVTTAGPDRVLVQCFPVPPNGGTMKIRFGITAPVDLESPEAGVLRLPFLTEHNFSLPETPLHSLWMESKAPLGAPPSGSGLITEQTADGSYALRGTLPCSAILEATAVRVARNAAVMTVDEADERGTPPGTVRQTLRETTVAAPSRLVVVIDGSRRMSSHVETLARAISAIPDGMEFRVLLAGDSTVEISSLQRASALSREQAVDALGKIRFAGGCDNVTPLAQAWDAAAGAPGGVILWLHATQPVPFTGTETLRQRWERRPDNPALLGLQFGTGPDVVMQALADFPAVRQLGRTGNAGEDLARQMALWAGTARHFTPDRVRMDGAQPDLAGGSGSSHIARLWALDEIRRLSAQRGDAAREQAVALAGRYQLVTPVSGAVVLETREQFEQAGLEPVSADTVPVVPEPETWILFGMGSVILLLIERRRRRAEA